MNNLVAVYEAFIDKNMRVVELQAMNNLVAAYKAYIAMYMRVVELQAMNKLVVAYIFMDKDVNECIVFDRASFAE